MDNTMTGNSSSFHCGLLQFSKLFLAQEDHTVNQQPANEGDNTATNGKIYNICEIIYCQRAVLCLHEAAAESWAESSGAE